MRGAAAALPALLLAAGSTMLATGCSGKPSFYGDEFSHLFKPPAEVTSQEPLDTREILHWVKNPREKHRVGYLVQYNTQVRGTRDNRDCWYIFDRWASKRVGFITAEGVFYRFDERGQLGERVGEWQVVNLGLKIFFGIPLGENLDLDPIDPYR